MDLLLFGLAAAALFAFGRRRSGGSSTSTGGGGWSRKSDAVELSAEAVDFLDALAAKVDFAFVVTSGTRSYEEQAAAMRAKVEAGEDLYDLYTHADQHELLDALFAAYEDEWPAIIEEYVETRGVVLSWHLVGDAVDLRTRDLTEAQVEELRAAAVDLGADALVESDHLHIEEF